jgi:hypothetical protein
MEKEAAGSVERIQNEGGNLAQPFASARSWKSCSFEPVLRCGHCGEAQSAVAKAQEKKDSGDGLW